MNPTALIRETFQTAERNELVDITQKVQQAVDRAKVREGMVIVYTPHTTGGMTINENTDPDVRHDLLRKLAELCPRVEPYYQHTEGNSDGHVKSSLMGASVTVLVENGKLMLGRWQAVYFCEFDGPRERQAWIKPVSFAV